MPLYRVWYRDNPEPLEFTAAGRCNDKQILDHVLGQEGIGASAAAPEQPAPSLQELIARNNLAPVRYTEDESEINIIG